METITDLQRVLGEDYDQIRPLGQEGGLSRLFCARKKSLELDVVIKRMKMDPNQPESVKREARVMTSLRHQYLPRIFGFETDAEGYCYTVMEKIPGCTMRQYLEQYGALSQKQTLAWMEQICQAVSYMHSQNPAIIHSDIKPENIMITTGNTICLIDFNAALEMKENGVQAVGATPGYAAPEQYNVPLRLFGDPANLSPALQQVYTLAQKAQGAGKVTEKTDVYAIGAVAYFMLTGYNPASWEKPLIPLSRFDIVLGEPLRLIIEKCMEKDPAKRYQSVEALGKALANLEKTDKRYRTWRRGCQLSAFLVGACFVTSAFLTALGYLQMQKQDVQQYNQLIAQAQQSAAQQDVAAQQEYLSQAISLIPQRPEAYANLGALLYQQGDYAQAISLLDAIAVDDTNALVQQDQLAAYGQVQYVLGACYYQTQQYVQALQCYQIAAHFDPENGNYLRDLAVCYAKTGDLQQAEETLSRMETVQVQPGDLELVAGEIAGQQQDHVRAFEQFSAAIAAGTDAELLTRASVELAATCAMLPQEYISQQITYLELAVNKLPNAQAFLPIQLLAQAWMQQAAAEPEQKETAYQQALAWLEELDTRGQATLDTQLNRATVLQALGRWQQAEELLLALCDAYGQNYKPYARLALLYLDALMQLPVEQRSYEQALECYEKASALYNQAQPDSDMLRLQELVAQLGIG